MEKKAAAQAVEWLAAAWNGLGQTECLYYWVLAHGTGLPAVPNLFHWDRERSKETWDRNRYLYGTIFGILETNEFESQIERCFFSRVLSPHSSRANYSRNSYRWYAVIWKPRSTWLEGTPAIYVTCSYVL